MKKFIDNIERFYTSEMSSWVLRGVFFVYSFLLLGVLNYDILYQLFWKNYFLYNQVFYAQTMFQSGGLLIYIGRFLNQIFCCPIVAACIVSLLLVFLEYLISFLFDKESRFKVLCFVPSFLLLHELTTVAYALYDQLEISYFFAPLVGLFYVLSFYAAHLFLRNKKWCCYLFLIATALLFPWIGFYSLMAGFLIALDEYRKDNRIAMIVQILLCPLELWLTSYCYSERLSHVLWSPLPDTRFVELFVPALLSVVLLFLFPLKNRVKSKMILSSLTSMAMMVGLIVALLLWNTNDSHNTFRKEMRLSRLCDEQDWHKLLKTINNKERITHTMNAYRVIALANTNGLGKDLFNQRMPFKTSPSEYRSEITIFYPDIFLYSSFISVENTAVFEQWVTFGENYKLLKQLAFCAIINGEKELAYRYVNIMKEAPCLRSLANDLEKCIGNNDVLIEKFPYCKNILDNRLSQDVFLSVQYQFAENYKFYHQLDGINVERRLYADLFLGDIKAAVGDAKVASRVVQYFPPCVQEAFVMMYLDTKNSDYMRQIPIDKNVAIRVQSLVNDFYAMKNPDRESVGEKLFARYGDMFSYYYLINYGLK